MRRNFDLEQCSCERFRRDHALLTRRAPHRADTARGSEELHQCGEVVRAHVEERPRPELVEDRRARVPPLGSRGEHEGVGSERFADVTAVDDGPARLQAGAEERVRRATEPHALPGGERDQLGAFFVRDAERLLAEHRLPGRERRTIDAGVHLRRRQVHDRVDLGVFEDRFESEGACTPLLGAFLRAVREHVGARDDVDPVEYSECVAVGAADHTAPDNGEAVHERPRDKPLPTRYS